MPGPPPPIAFRAAVLHGDGFFCWACDGASKQWAAVSIMGLRLCKPCLHRLSSDASKLLAVKRRFMPDPD